LTTTDPIAVPVECGKVKVFQQPIGCGSGIVLFSASWFSFLMIAMRFNYKMLRPLKLPAFEKDLGRGYESAPYEWEPQKITALMHY
jgi:hypothetical protein